MSALTIYHDIGLPCGEHIRDFSTIRQQLAAIGVQFERWDTQEIVDNMNSDAILAAYQSSIDTLNKQYAFQSVDVIHLNSDHPDKVAIRQKFLAEHTHDDFEIRFFVRGQGLFYLHHQQQVFVVLCEEGDLISVPAHVKHWFDLGENPTLSAIRLFTTDAGWVAEFTGSDIAGKFPCIEDYLIQLQTND